VNAERIFTEEDRKKAKEARISRARREASFKPMKIHGSRLSLADYLNENEPPFVTLPQAIRLRCLDCVGNVRTDILTCSERKCSLWRYRMGSEVDNPEFKRLSRSKSIRADCLDCCGSCNEVNLCPAVKCSLWPYRLMGEYRQPDQARWSTHRRWCPSWDCGASRPGRGKKPTGTLRTPESLSVAGKLKENEFDDESLLGGIEIVDEEK
jgi:hypothetical protein